MAKIDVSTIEGYENMTPEQKIAALEGFDMPDPDYSGYVKKDVFDKTASELASTKKQLKDKMTDDEAEKQKEKEEREKLQKDYEELLHKTIVSEHKAKFLAMGYDEKLAEETAEAMASGDTAKVFANQQKHLEAYGKKVRAEALKDTPKPTPDVVLVPDTCLYNHVMNDTNITTGAYVGSKMYTEGLARAKTTIKAAFSGHVLSKRIYLSNATSNGRASAGAWCDSEVDLMCEHMVYGNGVFSPVSDGTAVPNNHRVEKSQLPLFQYEPSRICNRATWWLRDVITASSFARVNHSGAASDASASDSLGVRPAFCIS